MDYLTSRLGNWLTVAPGRHNEAVEEMKGNGLQTVFETTLLTV